ncbi:PRD domain-containing protein [Carnobacterium maltaromaticum]|uniref:PRD domain-containing protein n=1 Tax=Carnobacterium maltaromaticum TaxID=2751 RepID=A0AAW9K6Q5_CARML|nr:PRD domain-containing protein [Carnobacterium maltaromaticum]MDZ5759884.1 PRD domain-containing protein [Carnobacterium maltaromaticum]
MIVRQILNNNIALVDRGGHESIVYSTGISFKKKVGQQLDDSEVERVYVLDSKDRLEHFSYLLSQSDEQTTALVNELVSFGEKEVGTKANDYLYLALLDHIVFALSRAKKGQFIRSPLAWEVKKFYPVYFKIGLHALELMHELYKIEFPEDEAISIALHFVNLQENQIDLDGKLENMEILRDMLNIIKYHFNMNFDETSMTYLRLVTHLQYFIERLRLNNPYEEKASLLFQQVKELYPESFAAIEKIAIYVKGRFNQELSKEEFTYLMIHINRVTERKKDET